jgi:hypothetical protein
MNLHFFQPSISAPKHKEEAPFFWGVNLLGEAQFANPNGIA